MSSVSQKSRSRKTKPFACKLISAEVEVSGHRYHVEPIPAGEDGSAAFRMVKHGSDDAVYDLVRTYAGLVECTCADYECRRRGLTCKPCKHGRALIELGLLPPVSPNFGPIPEPSPAAASEPEPAPCYPPGEALPCTNCAGRGVVRIAMEAGPNTLAYTTCPDCDPEASAPADMGLDGSHDDPLVRLMGPPATSLPFAERIDVEAAYYRSLGTDFADWMASQVAALAEEARYNHATSPAEFDARRDCQAAWYEDRLRAEGRAEGPGAVRRSLCRPGPAGSLLSRETAPSS
jgi:hypothetical protein